jgi:hypothetical protein
VSASDTRVEPAPRPETTVGTRADHLIYDWAQAADVAGPLALVAAAMRIRTETQAVLFRSIVDSLGPTAGSQCDDQPARKRS